mmetsp:Transcript_19038/g.41014  ORF Transcript_19038/g.41014 Transcript_19038/m.41014 type:complete len:343 (+) Transcript_19038:78-1106(+)
MAAQGEVPSDSLMSRPGLYGGFGQGSWRFEDNLVDNYGSLVDPIKAPYANNQRTRLNAVSMFQALVFPWVFFCLIYALMSFRLRYTNPALCWGLATGAVVLVGLHALYLAYLAWQRRRAIGITAPKAPTWFTFLNASFLLSWTLGVILGSQNFGLNMSPYFDYIGLNEYVDVNPSKQPPQEVMDGSRFQFVNNSVVDVRKAMGFRNLDTYCVAPIALRSPQGLVENAVNYNYWAVGLDCCSKALGDFHCGDVDVPSAHDGLRVLREDHRSFFRLAVQQAEAAYSVRAEHPVFVYWSRNATAEMNFFQEEGYKYYLVGMLAHFGWQMLAVAVISAAFSKARHL